MTDAQCIRDWLRDRPEGASAPEIARGAEASMFAVYQLHKYGMLAREGEQRRYRYVLVREPVPAMDDDVRAVRRRDQERDRRRRLGVRPVDEVRAELRAQAQQRAAEVAKELEVRRAARLAARAAAKAAPKPPKPKAAKPPKVKRVQIVIEPRPAPVTAAPKREKPRQTVEEFLAAGGQIERLPPPWAGHERPYNTVRCVMELRTA